MKWDQNKSVLGRSLLSNQSSSRTVPFAIKTKALRSSVRWQPYYFDRQLLQRLPIPTKQPLTTSPIMPWGADNTRLADLFNAGPLNTLSCGQTQHSDRQKELVCLFQCEWGCFGRSWYIIKTAATLHTPMLWKEALWNLGLSVRGVYNATGEICGVQRDAAHTRLSINSIAPMHLSVATCLINISPECRCCGVAGINTLATKNTITERALSAFKNSNRSQYT